MALWYFMSTRMGLRPNRSRSWGASGRWFKSSRPDHLKAADSHGKPDGLRPSPSPVSGAHPTETLRLSGNACEGAFEADVRVVLPEKLLTVREVADRLGVCRATMYAMVERGELPAVRIGAAVRVDPADHERRARLAS